METFSEKELGEIFIHEGVTLRCVESEQGDQWINDCVDEHKCHLLNR